MKKNILAIIVVSAFAVFAIYSRSNTGVSNNTVADVNSSPVVTQDNPVQTKTSSQNVAQTDNTNTSVNNSNNNSQSVPTPAPAQNNNKYKDGTFIGDSVNVYYGNVQVQVSISNGKINKVVFLDHPSDNPTSVRKYNMAAQTLISEVIQSQDSNVDAVSGASADSSGFNKSLSSALDKALN